MREGKAEIHDSAERGGSSEAEAPQRIPPEHDNHPPFTPNPQESKSTRLSVNISQDTFEALQEVAHDKGISITEAVRRLIGYGIIVHRSTRDGHDVLIRRGHNKLERIVILD